MRKLIFSIVILAISVKSQAGPSCDDVLGACSAALEARKAEIKLCDLALSTSREQGLSTRTELEESNAKLASVWHQPLVMILLGVVAGGVATMYVTSK